MIDDDSRIDYPKGIVVNPSIYGDKLRYPKKEDVKYLLGKDYIILRREFWDVPEKIINKEVRNILVTFGGISKRKMRNEIIEYLNSRFNFNFTVVNPWENKLTALQMLGLMLKADICVSAGGQTTYELARMGVPTIGICFFENQRLNLEGWQEKGYIEYIGWCNEKDLLKKIEDAIIKLESHKERIRRSQIGRNYVDGKGVKRIVYKIVGDSQ